MVGKTEIIVAAAIIGVGYSENSETVGF